MTCHECGTDLRAMSADLLPAPFHRFVVGVLLASLIGFVAFETWIEIHPVTLDGILIRGEAKFKKHVVAALGLLKTRSPFAYAIVTNNIGIFAQSKHSGMEAECEPPTSYLHDKRDWESTEAYAATIAHESFHSKLYHDYLKKVGARDASSWLPAVRDRRIVPDAVYSGEAAEKACWEHQARVLKEVGGSPSEIGNWDPSNRYWEIPFFQRDW